MKVADEVLELARQHGAEAIDRLVTLMRSNNDAVALRAAEALLDRAYGRPRQAVAVEHEQAVQIVFRRAETHKPEIPEFAEQEPVEIVFRSSRGHGQTGTELTAYLFSTPPPSRLYQNQIDVFLQQQNPYIGAILGRAA